MREFTPPGCGLVRQMNGLVPCGFSPAVSCVDLKKKIRSRYYRTQFKEQPSLPYFTISDCRRETLLKNFNYHPSANISEMLISYAH
jgi:hypothetical protein